MPALGHRIIGLKALLAQQVAAAAAHVPQGPSPTQAQGSRGEGLKGQATTATRAPAAGEADGGGCSRY